MNVLADSSRMSSLADSYEEIIKILNHINKNIGVLKIKNII